MATHGDGTRADGRLTRCPITPLSLAGEEGTRASCRRRDFGTTHGREREPRNPLDATLPRRSLFATLIPTACAAQPAPLSTPFPLARTDHTALRPLGGLHLHRETLGFGALSGLHLAPTPPASPNSR